MVVQRKAEMGALRLEESFAFWLCSVPHYSLFTAWEWAERLYVLLELGKRARDLCVYD